MPPREEIDDQSCDEIDALAESPTLLSKQNSNNVSNLLTKHKPSLRLRERRRPRIIFRSKHGTFGIMSTFLVCLSICAQDVNILSFLAAFSSIITASSGTIIVDQAPKQTIIMERPFKVIPPHRDAFQRTAYSIYYLCARICWNNITSYHRATTNESAISDTSNWIWGISVLCYTIIKFVPSPHGMDLTNGNTWVFVIPMASGLIVDALFQLPMLQCEDSLCWNEDVITQLELLYVLLSGLIVAFVFTLAFRGVLGMRNCYWGAALVVHAIVAYLIVKALPFMAIQLL